MKSGSQIEIKEAVFGPDGNGPFTFLIAFQNLFFKSQAIYVLTKILYALPHNITNTGSLFYSGDCICFQSTQKSHYSSQKSLLINILKQGFPEFIGCEIIWDIYKKHGVILKKNTAHYLNNGEKVYNKQVILQNLIFDNVDLKKLEKEGNITSIPNQNIIQNSDFFLEPILKEKSFKKIPLVNQLNIGDYLNQRARVVCRIITVTRSALLPKAIKMCCAPKHPFCSTLNCPFYDNPNQILNEEHEIYAAWIEYSKSKMKKFGGVDMCKLESKYSRIEVMETIMVHRLLIDIEDQHENFSEPMEILFVGNVPIFQKPLEISGTVVLDEKHCPILIASVATPMNSAYPSVNKSEFQIFRNRNILSNVIDIQENLIKVIGSGRFNHVFMDLLQQCSPLELKFENELIRGAIHTLEIGDSGTAKSLRKANMMKIIPLEMEIVYCDSASRTGLTYGIDNFRGQAYIKPGALPKNDRNLVHLDEIQNLPKPELPKFRSVLTEGILKVDRICSAKFKSQVRVSMAGNPPTGKLISDYCYGVEAFLEHFEPADLRRFDMGITTLTTDVSIDEQNKTNKQNTGVEAVITPSTLRNLILWARQLTADDIHFLPETQEVIYQQAKFFRKKYESALSIPLVSADQHHKLARLGAALSVFCNNEDANGRVIVEPQHIKFVSEFLDRVYSGSGMQLDKFAESKRKPKFTETTFNEIFKELMHSKGKRHYKQETILLLDLINQHGQISRHELMERTGLGKDALNARIRVLKNHNLIKNLPGGYQKAEFFSKFYQIWRENHNH